MLAPEKQTDSQEMLYCALLLYRSNLHRRPRIYLSPIKCDMLR